MPWLWVDAVAGAREEAGCLRYDLLRALFAESVDESAGCFQWRGFTHSLTHSAKSNLRWRRRWEQVHDIWGCLCVNVSWKIYGNWKVGGHNVMYMNSEWTVNADLVLWVWVIVCWRLAPTLAWQFLLTLPGMLVSFVFGFGSLTSPGSWTASLALEKWWLEDDPASYWVSVTFQGAMLNFGGGG